MTEQKQLTIYDAVTPVPPLWDCRETCRRFGEMTDSPEWWNGEKRCLLCNGNTMKHANFDNRCYIYCTLYEPKDGGDHTG